MLVIVYDCLDAVTEPFLLVSYRLEGESDTMTQYVRCVDMMLPSRECRDTDWLHQSKLS